MNDKAKFNIVSQEQKYRIEETRKRFSSLYDYLKDICKNSRETSLAMTKLEEAQF